MFVVAVTLTLKEGAEAAFMPLMIENARLSRETEVGCHLFDICVGENETGAREVFLYEIYTDAAAFEAHLQTRHYKSFDAAVSEMIATKVLKTYDEVIR
ncbi:putative quinol monooxygenase [Celeribacter sp.]|uniref:putative quinol monooxygenase n=1 Tax=Celeribacter sp. TaxID=1890673 RepID=UPI003A8DAC7F